MFCDVTTLDDFYQSALGQTAATVVKQHIHHEEGLKLSIGFPEPFIDDPQDHFVVMPAQQGATRQNSLPTVLAYEDHLPFEDATFRQVMLVHIVESTEYRSQLLQECWRVLDAHGQLIVIIASRRGVWSHSENTPFGYGHPFSARQMEAILTNHRFTVDSVDRALYFMPNSGLLGLKGAKLLEKIGGKIFTRMSGVIILHARKEVFSKIKPAKRILPRIELPTIAPQTATTTSKPVS